MPYADPEKARANQRERRTRPDALERERETARKRYASESEAQRAARTARAYAWQRANPEKVRASGTRARVKRLYGLTEADYVAMLAKQGGLCAICRKPQSVRRQNKTPDRLAIDHDHATGKVRGLLCHNCNHALGKMRDDPSLLRAAIAYLEGAQCK